MVGRVAPRAPSLELEKDWVSLTIGRLGARGATRPTICEMVSRAAHSQRDPRCLSLKHRQHPPDRLRQEYSTPTDRRPSRRSFTFRA